MKLGDLFWIKLYGYKKGDYFYDDTLAVMRVAKEKFDIDLSFLEALKIWDYVSGCRCASWLYIEGDEDIAQKIGYLFKDNYLD